MQLTARLLVRTLGPACYLRPSPCELERWIRSELLGGSSRSLRDFIFVRHEGDDLPASLRTPGHLVNAARG